MLNDGINITHHLDGPLNFFLDILQVCKAQPMRLAVEAEHLNRLAPKVCDPNRLFSRNA